MAHSLGRNFLPTSHPTLSISHCDMPVYVLLAQCAGSQLIWCNPTMFTFWLWWLRDGNIDGWRGTTRQVFLSFDWLEIAALALPGEPPVPHSSTIDILAGTIFLQLINFSFSTRGIFGHTIRVDFALYPKWFIIRSRLYWNAFWQYKHCTLFLSSKNVRYGFHTKVCFRRAAIFGEKNGFVVSKENYGDPDYKCDYRT
jgi:hypothetical protein